MARTPLTPASFLLHLREQSLDALVETLAVPESDLVVPWPEAIGALISNTQERNAQLLMHLRCPYRGQLLPSTVLLHSVNNSIEINTAVRRTGVIADSLQHTSVVAEPLQREQQSRRITIPLYAIEGVGSDLPSEAECGLQSWGSELKGSPLRSLRLVLQIKASFCATSGSSSLVSPWIVMYALNIEQCGSWMRWIRRAINERGQFYPPGTTPASAATYLKSSRRTDPLADMLSAVDDGAPSRASDGPAGVSVCTLPTPLAYAPLTGSVTNSLDYVHDFIVDDFLLDANLDVLLNGAASVMQNRPVVRHVKKMMSDEVEVVLAMSANSIPSSQTPPRDNLTTLLKMRLLRETVGHQPTSSGGLWSEFGSEFLQTDMFLPEPPSGPKEQESRGEVLRSRAPWMRLPQIMSGNVEQDLRMKRLVLFRLSLLTNKDLAKQSTGHRDSGRKFADDDRFVGYYPAEVFRETKGKYRECEAGMGDIIDSIKERLFRRTQTSTS